MKLWVIEDLTVDGVVAQKDVVVVSTVDDGQYESDEQNVAQEVVDHQVERSLSQEDFVSADDELSAGRLVVWMHSHVVNDQPAKNIGRIQLCYTPLTSGSLTASSDDNNT